MVITVRRATKDDMGTVLEMMHELAEFQNMPDGPKLTLEDLLRDGGFNESETISTLSMYICFVAEIQQDSSDLSANIENSNDVTSLIRPPLIGYAFCHYAYSSWLGKTLFLEDLYVKATQRYCGIGRQIFTEVVKFAKETHCKRVYFHVMDGNPASEFYVKMKAVNLTASEGWQFYYLNKDEIDSY